MSVLQRMVDVIKCALIHRVHINAAVIQDIPKMDPNAQVCLPCWSGVLRAGEYLRDSHATYSALSSRLPASSVSPSFSPLSAPGIV